MFSADVSTDFDNIRSHIQLLLAMAPSRQTAVSLETALLVLTSAPRSAAAAPRLTPLVAPSPDALFFDLDLLLALAAEGEHRRDVVICRMWLATAQRHWRSSQSAVATDGARSLPSAS